MLTHSGDFGSIGGSFRDLQENRHPPMNELVALSF